MLKKASLMVVGCDNASYDGDLPHNAIVETLKNSDTGELMVKITLKNNTHILVYKSSLIMALDLEIDQSESEWCVQDKHGNIIAASDKTTIALKDGE